MPARRTLCVKESTTAPFCSANSSMMVKFSASRTPCAEMPRQNSAYRCAYPNHATYDLSASAELARPHDFGVEPLDRSATIVGIGRRPSGVQMKPWHAERRAE